MRLESITVLTTDETEWFLSVKVLSDLKIDREAENLQIDTCT